MSTFFLYGNATDLEQSTIKMSVFILFGLVLVTQRKILLYIFSFFFFFKGSQKRHFLTKESFSPEYSEQGLS